MLCMKLRLGLVATLLSLLPVTLAHGHVRYLTIGGQGYNGFNPSWPPELGPTPIRPTDNADQGWADYWSPIVATGGMNPGQNVLTAKGNAGDRVELFWIVWENSHKGSVTEWMAYCGQDSCDGIPGADLDWFKIQEDSFAEGHWPTERINYDTNHTWSFNLPTDLKSGKYLVRHELLAMHTVNEPQFYPVTFQLDLTSSGSTMPSPTGRFPDMYMHDNMATWHNIYSNDNTKFKVPGIPVYSRSEAGSGSTGGSGSDTPAPAQPGRPSTPGSGSHGSSCKARRRRRRIRK